MYQISVICSFRLYYRCKILQIFESMKIVKPKYYMPVQSFRSIILTCTKNFGSQDRLAALNLLFNITDNGIMCTSNKSHYKKVNNLNHLRKLVVFRIFIF